MMGILNKPNQKSIIRRDLLIVGLKVIGVDIKRPHEKRVSDLIRIAKENGLDINWLVKYSG